MWLCGMSEYVVDNLSLVWEKWLIDMLMEKYEEYLCNVDEINWKKE